MRRTIAIVAAAVVLLLGVGVGAVVLMHTDDDPGWQGHPMSSRWMGGAMGGGMGGGWGAGPGARSWSHHVRVTSEADYLRTMIAHHREAVEAATELSRSERPAMRALGRDIVLTQTAQIRQMEGWLAEWYPDEPTSTDYEPMMRDLSGLSGDALDRTFLQDMIGHHMAAVMMSQQLLVRGIAEHDEVADLARTIRDDQMDEIRWMRAMWSTMSG